MKKKYLSILIIFLIFLISFLFFFWPRCQFMYAGTARTEVDRRAAGLSEVDQIDNFIGHDAGGFNISSAIRGYDQNQQKYYKYWMPGYNNTSIYKNWIYDNRICRDVNSLDDLIKCIPEIKNWEVESNKWREIRPFY